MDSVLKSAKKYMAVIGLSDKGWIVNPRSKFNKSKLPTPESFWSSHGVAIKVTKGWISVKCVFHDDEYASLSINVETGGFYCQACGSKGGDVLDAHRLLSGCDFVTAAKELGTWKGN